MTPAGIEPAIFRFVAQHVNHCATMLSSTYLLRENPNVRAGGYKMKCHEQQ